MWQNIIQYCVRKHLLTNMVLILVIAGGIMAWRTTSKEELPDFTSDTIRVNTVYPGAPAADVEYFVTKPLEEELRGLDGVFRITSSSSVGSSSVNVELEPNVEDVDAVLTEVRNAVLDVDLPEEVIDDPNVRIFRTSTKAILDIALIHKGYEILTVDGRQELQSYALALENQLISRPELYSVNRRGYLQEELRVEVDPAKLVEYDIPLSTVMREIRANHVRKPAGSLETIREPKVTLLSELDSPDKLKNLAIQGGFEGQVVKLSDIADVTRGYEKPKTLFKVNGHEAIIFNVVKSGSHGILEALDAATKVVDQFQGNQLEDTKIELVLLDDESIDVRNRLELITINGSIGFVLILVTLFIFLNWKSGIWVALGIPFTLCFTMIFASAMGQTINGMTLAAVIIVLGIVVDDAIVVAENISRKMQEGMSSEEAAVKGTLFVSNPIIASILTTCCAFVPLYFFDGRFGQLITYIPSIIFLMLAASLIESLFVLPGHMRLNFGGDDNGESLDERKAHWFERIEHIYARVLEWQLRHRVILILVFAVLLGWAAHTVTTSMRYVMFPNEETRDIVLNGRTPDGSTRYDTARKVREIEDIILSRDSEEVVGFRTWIARGRRGGPVLENEFSMLIEIVPSEKREKSANEIIAEIQEGLDQLKGFERLRFQKSRWGQGSGSPIEAVIQQSRDDKRHTVVTNLAAFMNAHPGLTQVEVDEGLRTPEFQVEINREMIKRLAIDPTDVSSTLRAALEGNVLYEFSNGDEDIRVRCTILDEGKDSMTSILSLPVENQGNYLVPLSNIVTVTETTTPVSIERRDLKRTSMIYADLNPESGMTPLEIAEDFEANIFPVILAEQPSTMLSFGGEIEDTRASTQNFRNAIILVVLLIFFVLAVLFNSIIRALIVMSAIPFGVAGVIIAFHLHGKDLFGFYAAIGTLGMIGVVINDAIIMMRKLDDQFEVADNRRDADRQIASIAGTRLRAVVLTTLTTVAGVAPTAYGFAGYDATLAEMMLALVWGMVFGTAITLALIPAIYSVFQSITRRFSKKSAAKAVGLIVLGVLFLPSAKTFADTNENARILPPDEFLQLAAANDTEFERILANGLALQYAAVLTLPSADLIASVKQEYYAFFDSERDDGPATTIGLSKLFPFSGTEIDLGYKIEPSLTGEESSSLTLTIAQPIAENAFGRSTRLLDRITGLEVDVARHQIAEAYEDYLALVINAYIDWYAAYQKLLIGEKSYKENLKLLDNTLDRQKKQIALPIDVNKTKLLVLARKENLIEFEEDFKNATLVIKRMSRLEKDEELIPASDFPYSTPPMGEDQLIDDVYTNSRTFSILRTLEEQSDLVVENEADDLLPSINLLIGYEEEGSDFDLRDSESLLFAGIQLDWPVPNSTDKAEREVAEINASQRRLDTMNVTERLATDIRNLLISYTRGKTLLEIADEKIELSISILEDETENYTFGRVTLNDFISSVNVLDNNRIQRVSQEQQNRKQIIELLRLSDSLIKQVPEYTP